MNLVQVRHSIKSWTLYRWGSQSSHEPCTGVAVSQVMNLVQVRQSVKMSTLFRRGSQVMNFVQVRQSVKMSTLIVKVRQSSHEPCSGEAVSQFMNRVQTTQSTFFIQVRHSTNSLFKLGGVHCSEYISIEFNFCLFYRMSQFLFWLKSKVCSHINISAFCNYWFTHTSPMVWWFEMIFIHRTCNSGWLSTCCQLRHRRCFGKCNICDTRVSTSSKSMIPRLGNIIYCSSYCIGNRNHYP